MQDMIILRRNAINKLLKFFADNIHVAVITKMDLMGT